jgi:hypothetical protein
MHMTIGTSLLTGIVGELERSELKRNEMKMIMKMKGMKE